MQYMKNILKKNRFYVYAYLDPRKPGKYKYGKYKFDYEPFYIGKGCSERISRHLSLSYQNAKINPLKEAKIRKIIALKLIPVSIKIKINLTENKAFLLEKYLVDKIGKIITKKGPLSNLIDGGKNGGLGKIVSKKTRIRLSNSLKNRVITIPWRIKICLNNSHYWKNKKQKVSVIAKIKRTKRNHKQSQKHRYRIYELTSPKGKKYIIKNGLEKFCLKHNLKRAKLVDVANGRRNHHHHWTCKIIDNKIFPKDRTYKLKNLINKKEFITNKIIMFSKRHNLDSRRLYEVARGERYCHRGWRCEVYKL